MSGGERKTLAVARALMLKPEVSLLDEPTAGLSPEISTNRLHEQVRRLADVGSAIFVVEQKAQAALEIWATMHVLASGTVNISAAPKGILSRYDLDEVVLGQSI
jgi:ABC-type branched-subunit amino acid transport system ATPase component